MSVRWKDTSLGFEERADDLVSQMTLEEKVSQLTFASSALPRFGIPEYHWWNECLHGVARAGTATMFPQSIGMAASFDPPLLHRAARAISDEARVKHNAAVREGDRGIYKGLTMWSPNVNIFRDPRWGRGHETYGEDPYLTSRMGVAFITGLQGDDPKYLQCVATAKHFAVHSGPEKDRHHFDAAASPRDKAQTYFPAFRAAVAEARVASVMGAYNRVDGEAACASEALLARTLRGAWGFTGCVVSDCGAIEDIYEHHHLADTPEEAAALAVANGCDLCCGWAFPHLLKAVERGLIAEDAIDRAARRVLLARFRLGLFDPPGSTPWDDLPDELNDCDAHHELSLQMARESLVLLQNDGALPLDASKLTTLAVIGPNADDRAALYGNYCGTPSITYTVLEGLRQLLPHVRLVYAQGCPLTGGSPEEAWGEDGAYRLAEALSAARQADATVLVTGLNGEHEGEEGSGTGDREDMLLPQSQRALIDALATVDKPLILVNMTGSPTIFPRRERMNAIVQAWYPGQMGGLAVAEMLLGRYSPSGRLPVTFYRDMAQVPPFADYSMRGRTYRYLGEEPAFPFGFGLGYADFAYGAPRYEGGGLRFTLTNRSAVEAREVAMAFITLDQPRYPAPVKQLAAFEGVTLAPGETCELTLTPDPFALTEYDDEGNPAAYHGPVTASVGGQTIRYTV